MVQIVRSASCFRPRVRHLPLRIQHRRPVGTVICRFSEWCSAHLFVLPAIAKGLHVARLPFALENLSARCQADPPFAASHNNCDFIQYISFRLENQYQQ